MKISADVAVKQSVANRASKWPSRGEGSRLGAVCEPASSASFQLVPGEPIFTIGSCFARNVEKTLKQRGFRVPALEFEVPTSELWQGTAGSAGLLNKYTPHSMLNELSFAFSDSTGEEFLIEEREGLFIDGQLHTNVAIPYERAVERRSEIRKLYKSAIFESRIVIVTLGLIEAWWDTKNQNYLNESPVGRMLQKNPGRFQFEVLSPNNATSAVLDLLRLMKQFGREDQRVVLTVSPVPIQRTFTSMDALTANTYSKAVLRVAAQQATDQLEWVDYFPSFESVTLSSPELSWEDDLVHVKPPMIANNVDRMIRTYSQETVQNG